MPGPAWHDTFIAISVISLGEDKDNCFGFERAADREVEAGSNLFTLFLLAGRFAPCSSPGISLAHLGCFKF